MVSKTLERILMAGMLAATVFGAATRLQAIGSQREEAFAREHLQLCPGKLQPGETLYKRVQKALDEAGFPARMNTDVGKAYRETPLSPQDYAHLLAAYNDVNPRRITPHMTLYLPEARKDALRKDCLPGDVVYK